MIVDHIDVRAANARGIKVGHTPGVLSDAGEYTYAGLFLTRSVADITVMLVLMTMRRAGEGIQLVKSGGVGLGQWLPLTMRSGQPYHGHPSLWLGSLLAIQILP